MRKIIVATAIAIVAALAGVSLAWGHTGQVQVTCSGFTFNYQNFPANTTVNYTVYTAKEAAYGSFVISGAGSISISLNLTGAASVYLTWDAESGGRARGAGTLGCPTPATPEPPPTPPVYDYCGTGGPAVFAELLFDQPSWDPVWTGYTPAAYVQGLGSMCPWDIPVGYKDTGTKVDPVGLNYGGNEEGAIYEYWVKA